MNAKHIGILLLAGVALAGCGGGSASSTGTSTPATATVSINSSNQSTVTNAAIISATQNLGAGYTTSIGGVQTVTAPSNNRVLTQWVNIALDKMSAYPSALQSVSGISINTPYPCANSGTWSYNTDGIATSTSTFYTLTYSSCTTTSGSITQVIDGSLAITNIHHTNPLTASFNFNLTTTVTGQPTVKLVGGFDISASGVGTTTRTDSFSGTRFVVSSGSLNDALTNFSFTSNYDDLSSSGSYRSSFSDNVNYTIASDRLAASGGGGSYTFQTILPIVKNTTDLYPRDGQVIVYGANSTALRITVVNTDSNKGTANGTVILEISTNTTPGSLGNWIASPLKTWAQIAAGQ
jgi:hypothetical protein